MANNHCLLSASLDGTVCALVLLRYRNFRTFTTTSSRQFVSLAADQNGEVICAGTLDSFEANCGHEGSVHGLMFFPTNCESYTATKKELQATSNEQFKPLLKTAMFMQLMLVSCGKQRNTEMNARHLAISIAFSHKFSVEPWQALKQPANAPQGNIFRQKCVCIQ
ncbi:hypothetical protein V6N12_035159 [Hibiscus sabdariffa]|uniref:Uncharacterized protein n=1 Tax=Hibiscus sabdariffa TaxID=183260 RepID=A0ABR2ALR5_9ROSI